jgi:hypothetical protein
VRVGPSRAWVGIVPIALFSIAVVSGGLPDPLTALLVLAPGYSLAILLYWAWLPLVPDPFAEPAAIEECRARIAAEKAAKEKQGS